MKKLMSQMVHAVDFSTRNKKCKIFVDDRFDDAKIPQKR